MIRLHVGYEYVLPDLWLYIDSNRVIGYRDYDVGKVRNFEGSILGYIKDERNSKEHLVSLDGNSFSLEPKIDYYPIFVNGTGFRVDRRIRSIEENVENPFK